MVAAMEKSEEETAPVDSNPEENTLSSASHLLWQHLSSQLIYFVLFQFASFTDIVSALHKKVCMNHKSHKSFFYVIIKSLILVG
jgi:mediator of RNA polymerase II transcription subunit 23